VPIIFLVQTCCAYTFSPAALYIHNAIISYQLTCTFTLQAEDVRSLSDIDDLTTTFLKVRLLNYDYHTFC